MHLLNSPYRQYAAGLARAQARARLKHWLARLGLSLLTALVAGVLLVLAPDALAQARACPTFLRDAAACLAIMGILLWGWWSIIYLLTRR